VRSLPIARRALADRRRSLVIWAVGIVAYTAMILAVFPSLRGQTNLTDVMKNYPKPLLVMFGIDSENFDLGSATSFVNAYLYSAIIPMLVVVLCVLFGADTLAGEEDRNLLDLVLSYPVRRRSVVLQKALVLVIEAAAVGAALFLTVWIGGLAVDLRPPLGNLAGATVGLVALGVVFGGVALAVGAATGSKAAASGAAAAVAVATYLIWSMAKLVSWLEPLRWISPFWYTSGTNPIANGVAPRDLAAVVVMAVVPIAAAVLLFERRDLRR